MLKSYRTGFSLHLFHDSYVLSGEVGSWLLFESFLLVDFSRHFLVRPYLFLSLSLFACVVKSVSFCVHLPFPESVPASVDSFQSYTLPTFPHTPPESSCMVPSDCVYYFQEDTESLRAKTRY